MGRLVFSFIHIICSLVISYFKHQSGLLISHLDALASRLETEKHGELSLYASLCYICSGNLEKLVENWARNTDNNNAPLALQVSVF